MKNIPLQYEFRPELPDIPNVYGASDYREFRNILIKMDHLLCYGLEDRLIESAMNSWSSAGEDQTKSHVQSPVFQSKILRYALRCNIARHLTGESVRKFSIRLADSSLFQWFTGISGFESRKAASKSTLDRYEKYFDPVMLEKPIKRWLAELSDPVKAAESAGLTEPLSFAAVFMDSSCVKANIHFPVDWVLLRDAVRSLLLAIKTIRKQGLKHRMMEPAIFLRKMNQFCLQMTQTRRRKDSKKQRKIILRNMKALTRCIQKHAERYQQMLQARWPETNWTYLQAQQVIHRMDHILNQLPAAIHQAHERIIGERPIENSDKLLSLYEPDSHVIIRGKAEHEVEFGQGLLLCEQADGLLVDWQLFKDQPPSDSQLLRETVIRLEKDYGALDAVCTDRSFDSQANECFLKSHHIYDAMCPRSPQQLQVRLQESRFVTLQSRRGQTEARIGIFKNAFLGRPLRSKGFLHKQLSVNWCVLTHNLWVLARMAIAAEQTALQKAA